MTTIAKLYPDDEPARPRTQTQGYRFPPSKPTTVPPAHLCSEAELLDLAAGAACHAEQLWALLGSSDHVAAICRLLVEGMQRLELQHAAQLLLLQRQLAAALAIGAALQVKLEARRDATRLLLAERDRFALVVAATSAENAWLRRELAIALNGQRIEAAFERITVTVTGESYAVVAERLTTSVLAERERMVDDRFDRSEVIDVAAGDPPVPTTDGIDQSEPGEAAEAPLAEQPEFDPDQTTLDMDPDEVDGGEAGGA